jgi:hypothetical protein
MEAASFFKNELQGITYQRTIMSVGPVFFKMLGK